MRGRACPIERVESRYSCRGILASRGHELLEGHAKLTVMPIRGKATPEGTRQYAMKFPELVRARHFRDLHGLTVSSIGLGTYLGDEDEKTDRRYADSVSLAIKAGCNVIDSAINYRSQRSERNIGLALRSLMAPGSPDATASTEPGAPEWPDVVMRCDALVAPSIATMGPRASSLSTYTLWVALLRAM